MHNLCATFLDKNCKQMKNKWPRGDFSPLSSLESTYEFLPILFTCCRIERILLQHNILLELRPLLVTRSVTLVVEFLFSARIF